MLSGSALLRVLLLVAAAATLIGFTRPFWTGDSAPQDKPALVAAPATASARSTRRTEPPPRAAEAVARSAPAQPTASSALPAPADPRTAASETRSLFDVQPTAPRAAPAQSSVPAPAPVARKLAAADQEIAVAEESAQPRAIDLVDLNSGSLAELNGLKGAGSVGRAIVQHRPYASVDQLLSKRVLSRALYQRVKDQVTVR